MNNPDEIDINIDDINDTEGDVEEGNIEHMITHQNFYYTSLRVMYL